MNKLIGSNLKKIRTNCGITQQILADLMTIDQSAVSRIENGQQYLLACDLYILSRVMNVDINEFFKK